MQGGVLFIVCFIYPFLKVVREKKMNKLIAYAFALVAIFLTMMYVSSKTIDFWRDDQRSGRWAVSVSGGMRAADLRYF